MKGGKMAKDNRKKAKTAGLKARARSAYENASDKLEDTKNRTEDFILDRPFTAIGIAAGIGAIVGASTALGAYKMQENRRRNSLWAKLMDWF